MGPFATMSERLRSVGVLGTTYKDLQREMDRALAGISPERIVSISYSTSRILTLWLQHHALIVFREDQ
jgi:hypothetical protein